MSGAATQTVTTWQQHLAVLESARVRAVEELRTTGAFTWPDLAPPSQAPAADEVERLRTLLDDLAQLVAVGEQRHDELARSLSGAARRPEVSATVGTSLGDVLDVAG